MGKTSIQWTDRSVNPIRARVRSTDPMTEGKDEDGCRVSARSGHYCEKVSPGCRECYSSRMQPRFGLPVFQEQRTRDDIEIFLDVKILGEPLRVRKPQKWFWCDMTDMFGDWVSDEWIAACFGVMAATPHHVHQVLTKRPERMRRWLSFDWTDRHVGLAELAGYAQRALGGAVPPYGTTWPLPNVWLAVSVEDQKRADERIPHLLATPAAVRFVSYEPALGPVDFRSISLTGGGSVDAIKGNGWRPSPLTGVPIEVQSAALNMIIVGGESGPRARPFDLDWAASVIAQCRAADVSAFIKQLGRNPIGRAHVVVPFESDGVSAVAGGGSVPGVPIRLQDSHGGDMAEWPESLRVREFPR